MLSIPDYYLPIQVLGGVPQFPHPFCVGLETRYDPSYGQAGATRKGKRHYIFQYTFSGEGIFRDEWGTHLCPKGTGFLASSHNPKIAYGYPSDKSEPWQFLFLDFGGQSASTMAQDLIRRHGAIYELPLKHPILERLLSFRIYDQVGCAISSLEGSNLIIQLLHALLASKEEVPELKTGNTLVRNVLEYVQTHIDKPLSVTEIASHFRISREHLTRIFAQQSASSPHQYILNYKMSVACSLLHADDLSVKEISAKLGFDNVAHFTRAFKRIMQCTPSEYRNIGVLPPNTRLKSN